MHVTTSSNGSRFVGKGCTTLFLSIFAIVGFIFTGIIVRSSYDTIRSYFWTKTDCTIEQSSVGGKGDNAELHVRYTYRFNGRTYTGTRFTTGFATSMNAANAERAVQRYTPGTQARCLVNPSSPTESTLERDTPWLLAFVLLPIIFILVGVVGIIAVWRAKPASSLPVSDRTRNGATPALFIRLFGLLFICVGGGVMYVMLVGPMLKERTAEKWPQVPCAILSSNITSHRGNKSTTYSVNVRYRYTYRDREYTGTRYNFETGNSSSLRWRREAVDRLPAGTRTLCYVNPEDPVEAVLSVKPSPDRWFGLIPGVFLIVGLLIVFKAPAMAGRNISRTGLPPVALPNLPRDPVTGEVELKPASTPLAGFIILLIFALAWNGITWGILLSMPRGEWFGRIFLGIFVIIGGALGVGVIYSFLALFNPRPILTASAGAIPLGGTLDVRWRFTGNVRRLVHLAITLEGREEATYRRGTTTSTDKNVFAALPLIDTTERERITSGSARILIPRELIPTFTAPNNKIIWTLKLAGDVPKWPDVGAEFPITVLPRDASTLFQEQPQTT